MDASTRGAGVAGPPRGYGITVMSAWPRAMLNKLAVAPHIGLALLALPRPGSAELRRHRSWERRKPLQNRKGPFQSLPNSRTELI